MPCRGSPISQDRRTRIHPGGWRRRLLRTVPSLLNRPRLRPALAHPVEHLPPPAVPAAWKIPSVQPFLSALQQAEKSGNTSNLKSVIQNAVQQALQQNGINSQQLTSRRHGHHGHHGQSGIGQSGGTSSTNSISALLGTSNSGSGSQQSAAGAPRVERPSDPALGVSKRQPKPDRVPFRREAVTIRIQRCKYLPHNGLRF